LRREELFRILRRGSEKGALRTPRRGEALRTPGRGTEERHWGH
jgi:hypothetical protein